MSAVLRSGDLDFRKTRLRANPEYLLRAFNELSPAEQSFAQPLANDPEFFGLLTPQIGGVLPVKAVQTGDALLFLKLREACIVPDVFWKSNEDFETYLWQLVLDRVFEVEVEGRYVSGPQLIKSQPRPRVGPESVSDRALLYVATIALDDVQALAGRLYFFNRIPVRVKELSVPNNRSHTKAFLGFNENPDLATSALFREQRPGPDNISWMSWRNTRLRKTVESPFKLYICPYPEDLPGIFRDCMTVCGDRGAFSVKVGADCFTLSRPDKFVAYFNHKAELDECAAGLAPVLSNLRTHELAFAGTLPNPLLAWGVDPPKSRINVGWQAPSDSWRTWLVHRLAAALILAKRDGCTAKEAVSFTKDRVSLEGVDVVTWAPAGVNFT